MPVVPPDLKNKVGWDVSFPAVKTSPLLYKGRRIVAGGTVLTAKPLKQDGTRIEIIELPLGGECEPTGRSTVSQGALFCLPQGIYRSCHESNGEDACHGGWRSNRISHFRGRRG
jgi:starvation-inducible outer membrane lipoprotein